MRAKLFIAGCALAAMIWAVPTVGAAHFFGPPDATTPFTRTARLRVDQDRGLLVDAWINGRGPFIFVVDTGAGLHIISQRLVDQIGLPVKTVNPTMIGGLSSARTTASKEATLERVALGDNTNTLPSRQVALVAANLPADIDGVLDPTEAFAPNGFVVDMPRETIGALVGSLSHTPQTSVESAVVPWIRRGSDNRPFVRLGDGRIALIDTGSRFGLGVSEANAIIVARNGNQVRNQSARDIAGGNISFRRVAPTTVSVGDLVLRSIPTDILFGVDRGTPVLLGRDALYPFRLSFDPQQRLIQFVAAEAD